MTITPYGAAGGVTGTKHLIETDSARILLDCGMFQGPHAHERNRTLPIDPKSIDAVVVSHAHADHTGMLPQLVRGGFRGRIFMTPSTRDLTEHLLLDAASIEMHDAARRRAHRIGDPASWEPRMTTQDVPPVFAHVDTIPYARRDAKWHPILPGISCKFYDAGHILGSAIPVLDFDNGAQRIAFSGDLGQTGVPILHDPEVPTESIATLICESTYGDRIHEPFEAAVDALATVVRRVAARGGKIVIPAFSLGRTQLLVYLLHLLSDRGTIPRLRIVVDSPLAGELTEVFMRHRDDYDAETWEDFPGADQVPLAFRNLTYTRSADESRALNGAHGPMIIISASGMMTAGRVIHHLKHTIGDERNCILVTGFQAEGTTGRMITDGAPEVELFGEPHTVRAEVVTFDAFSAHADAPQLCAWAGAIQGIERVILVHGEPPARHALAETLRADHPSWKIDEPDEGEAIRIDT
ncbi:MAG: MBL fold metallo-hydrolase [Candidatus Uhrbacteria bacterium]